MAPRRRSGRTSAGPTLEASFGALLGFVPGYLFMESIFRLYPHPTHWVGALFGVGGGYGVGALVAAYKVRRPPFGPDRRRPAARAKRAGERGASKRARPGEREGPHER